MTRVRIHPDGCACDQAWAHRPGAAELAAARHAERQQLATRRRHGKNRGNVARLARARTQPPSGDAA